MSASTTHTPSAQARNLRWLLDNLAEEAPGIRAVAVVSSDGMLLLSSDQGRGAERQADQADGDGGGHGPGSPGAKLAAIVSGLGSLTQGAAELVEGGAVRQTMVSMEDGSLLVMSISDGSLLGVHTAPECDISVVVYQMALFVGRAGHVLTPELRTELRTSMELER